MSSDSLHLLSTTIASSHPCRGPLRSRFLRKSSPVLQTPTSCHLPATATSFPFRFFKIDRHYYATSIAAPPPSRGNTPLRQSITRPHAAGRKRNAFGYGKRPCPRITLHHETRCSPILAFPSPPSCSRAGTPPTGASKRRESRRPIILRLVLFCFARIGEINELICYNSLLHTKLFLLLLTSLLPLVFFPSFHNNVQYQWQTSRGL